MGALTERQFGKLLADAAAKVFVSNNRTFPDFNTMGAEMASIIKDRAKNIDNNSKAYENYFSLEEIHAKKFGGVNMHRGNNLQSNVSDNVSH